MAAEYVIADVFTSTRFTGNQLAVFTDARAVPDDLLQDVAREIGFSETVYVYDDDVVRIFTPGTELPFAGHPVLGTAFVLTRQRGTSEVVLRCKGGDVPVAFDEHGRGRMSQPVPTWRALDDPGPLLAALGVTASELPVEAYVNGPRHVYVTLPSREAVAALEPDLGAVARVLGDAGVSCIAGEGPAWKSRMFGPGLGVAEDPATGSAAGPLAVHLARHGRIGWGEEITISQGVEIHRPSTLYAVAHADGPDGAVSKVEVAGDTVVVGRGSFEL